MDEKLAPRGLSISGLFYFYASFLPLTVLTPKQGGWYLGNGKRKNKTNENLGPVGLFITGIYYFHTNFLPLPVSTPKQELADI